MSTTASQSTHIDSTTQLIPRANSLNTINDASPSMAEPKYLAQSVQMFGINTDLRTAYDTVQQAWRDSSCRKIFFNRLRLQTPLHKPLQISKAVCMALGTLNNRLSLQQLILFLDMVRFLEEQEGSSYFLRSFGITILEAPNAERTIRRGVFSFVPLWVPEYQLLGRVSALQPSLHVGKHPQDIRWHCAEHVDRVNDKLRPIEKSRQLTAYEQSVKKQARFQFDKLRTMKDDYGSIDVHWCPRHVPCPGTFHGLYQLWVHVEEERNLTEMPEEVTDSDLLNIEEDTGICACCGAPPVDTSSTEEQIATVDPEGK